MKKRILLNLFQGFFYFLLSLGSLHGQVRFAQLGFDIIGDAAGDRLGQRVSTSANGLTLAVSAPENDFSGTDAGLVKVFDWNGSAWIQRGLDITGEAAGDNFGSSVSSSADGNIVAIGAPNNDGAASDAGQVRVYAWNGSAWVQRGDDIDGDRVNDRFGREVSLSADGNTLAQSSIDVLDPVNGNQGAVRIYDWNGTSWVLRGREIEDPTLFTGFFGRGISLSSDGNTVAVGFLGGAGQVRVYDWSGGAWRQRGANINGKAAGDGSGARVAISSDGNTVAFSSEGADVGGMADVGKLSVYDWNGGAWIQRGGDLYGDAANDIFGTGLSLSRDGNTVAGGSFVANTSTGYVKLFNWNGSAWVQVGSNITGDFFSAFGIDVSLTSNNTLAVGGTSYSTGAGYAQVFAPTTAAGSDITTVNFTETEDCGGPTEVTVEFTAGGTVADPSDFEGALWQVGFLTGEGVVYATEPMAIDAFTRTGNSLVRTYGIGDFVNGADGQSLSSLIGESLLFFADQIVDGVAARGNTGTPSGRETTTSHPFSVSSPGGVMENTTSLVRSKSSLGQTDSVTCAGLGDEAYEQVVLLDPLLGEIDTLFSSYNDSRVDSQAVYVCLTAPMGIPNSENYDLEVYENGPTQLFDGDNSMTHNGDLV
ncbi:MAG: FG-GAP repeat protein, partial [Saprospiraceae bacterium]|nr:FG-GAP repeat protein [Saprospiraceae bacterium]